MVGAETTREQTPYLPISQRRSPRTPQNVGKREPPWCTSTRTQEKQAEPDTELFRAAIRAIRAQCDVLIQVSTGGAVGMNVEERCGALKLVGADRPDMATLSTGTVNFGADVFWNPRPLIRDIASRIKALGLKPEIECFDVGMIDEARALEKESFITLPAHFDFVLGVGGALAATPEGLDFMRSYIPAGCSWTCAPSAGTNSLLWISPPSAEETHGWAWRTTSIFRRGVGEGQLRAGRPRRDQGEGQEAAKVGDTAASPGAAPSDLMRRRGGPAILQVRYD